MNTDDTNRMRDQDAPSASQGHPLPGEAPVLNAPPGASPGAPPGPSSPGPSSAKLVRRSVWIVLVLSLLSYVLYAPLLNFARASEVSHSEGVVASAAPVETLPVSDGEVLLCWCYVPAKLGRLVQDCALDGDAGGACGDVSSLRSVAEGLPTSPKYRPMTDSILALVRQKEEVVRAAKQENCLPVEAVQAARSMEPFAGEIRFVAEKADPHWKEEVLTRHFGSL